MIELLKQQAEEQKRKDEEKEKARAELIEREKSERKERLMTAAEQAMLKEKREQKLDSSSDDSSGDCTSSDTVTEKMGGPVKAAIDAVSSTSSCVLIRIDCKPSNLARGDTEVFEVEPTLLKRANENKDGEALSDDLEQKKKLKLTNEDGTVLEDTTANLPQKILVEIPPVVADFPISAASIERQDQEQLK